MVTSDNKNITLQRPSKSECIWFSDFIMILLWCCTIKKYISILVLWPLKLSLEAVVPPACSFLRPWQCVGCRLRLWLTPQSHSSRHSALGSSVRNPRSDETSRLEPLWRFLVIPTVCYRNPGFWRVEFSSECPYPFEISLGHRPSRLHHPRTNLKPAPELSWSQEAML